MSTDADRLTLAGATLDHPGRGAIDVRVHVRGPVMDVPDVIVGVRFLSADGRREEESSYHRTQGISFTSFDTSSGLKQVSVDPVVDGGVVTLHILYQGNADFMSGWTGEAFLIEGNAAEQQLPFDLEPHDVSQYG